MTQAEFRVLQSTETPSQQAEVLRINPLQALYIQLDDLNITLTQVLRELQNKPTGHIAPVTLTINSPVAHEEILKPVWFSFVITNDGPDDLEFSVNDGAGPYITLRPRETMPIDMQGSVIDRLYFKTRSGETASLRAYGVY